MVKLKLSAIRPGNNDRKNFAEGPLEELARSIAQVGLAQPITVRKKGKFHEIVAGERRWRAHLLYTEKVQSGEWDLSPHCKPGYIDAIVRSLEDEQASSIMLIENIQREDLDPIEEANAYKERMDTYDWSLNKVAKTVRKSPEFVQDRIRLLDLLPEIQNMVSKGILRPIYGVEIAVLKGDWQSTVVNWLIKQTYQPTRKQVRKFVSSIIENQSQGTFDLNVWFSESVVEAAEDEGKRVSDMLPSMEHLPKLPITKGNGGLVVDAYIAHLIQSGYTNEANVLMDFWRKMMKINKLQITPWDSQVLPLLDTEASKS